MLRSTIAVWNDWVSNSFIRNLVGCECCANAVRMLCECCANAVRMLCECVKACVNAARKVAFTGHVRFIHIVVTPGRRKIEGPRFALLGPLLMWLSGIYYFGWGFPGFGVAKCVKGGCFHARPFWAHHIPV